jgi:predicted HTH transcriptional regulator
LEFKSYELPTGGNDQLKHRENKILQSVCGFLNSGGGLLVWGAPSMVRNPHGKSVCKGTLKPVPQEYHKDDFIAKLGNNIIPSPQGARFYSFASGAAFVYLIEVEPSVYSPHQFGNKYYMRLDGQTVPAPHHYIEALFKKIAFPNLEAYLTLYTYQFLDDKMHAQLQFSILFRNQSPYLNDFDVHCRLFSSQGLILGLTTNPIFDLLGRDAGARGDYTDNDVAR